jgi:hypothetical protein
VGQARPDGLPVDERSCRVGVIARLRWNHGIFSELEA